MEAMDHLCHFAAIELQPGDISREAYHWARLGATGWPT